MNPALIAGAASLAGGVLGNRAAAGQARKNRKFQERMRNTQWQAAVSDMRDAGINPALAYSKGPAASPGGSMASQNDVVSPAVSSAMQARRLQADLNVVNAQAQKLQQEGRGAKAVADMAEAKLAAYGIEPVNIAGRDTFRFTGDPVPLLTRELRAGVSAMESKASVMSPMAAVAEAFLPIIQSLSGTSARGYSSMGSSRLMRMLKYEGGRPGRAIRRKYGGSR